MRGYRMLSSLDHNDFLWVATATTFAALQAHKDFETRQGRINFEFTDKEAIDRAILLIQKHLLEMPGKKSLMEAEYETKQTQY
jgi:hypothetical protein